VRESQEEKRISKKLFEELEQKRKNEEERYLREKAWKAESRETHRNSNIFDSLMNTNEHRLSTDPHMVTDSLGTPQLNKNEFYMDEPEEFLQHKEFARLEKLEKPEKFDAVEKLWQSRHMGW